MPFSRFSGDFQSIFSRLKVSETSVDFQSTESIQSIFSRLKHFPEIQSTETVLINRPIIWENHSLMKPLKAYLTQHSPVTRVTSIKQLNATLDHSYKQRVSALNCALYVHAFLVCYVCMRESESTCETLE